MTNDDSIWMRGGHACTETFTFWARSQKHLRLRAYVIIFSCASRPPPPGRGGFRNPRIGGFECFARFFAIRVYHNFARARGRRKIVRRKANRSHAFWPLDVSMWERGEREGKMAPRPYPALTRHLFMQITRGCDCREGVDDFRRTQRWWTKFAAFV